MAGVNYSNAIHFELSDITKCWGMLFPVGGDGSNWGVSGVTGVTGFSDFQKGMISMWIKMDGYPDPSFGNYSLCDWQGCMTSGGNTGGILNLEMDYGFNGSSNVNTVFSCSEYPSQNAIQFTSSTVNVGTGGWTAFTGISKWSGTGNANLGYASIDGSGNIVVPRSGGFYSLAASARVFIPTGGHPLTIDMCFIDVDTGSPIPGTDLPNSVGVGTNWIAPGFPTSFTIPSGSGDYKVYPAFKVTSGTPSSGTTITLDVNSGTNGNLVGTQVDLSAVIFDPPPNDGGWHHICCAYNLASGSSGVVLYIDGMSKTGTPYVGTNATSWGAMTIPGGDADGSGQMNVTFNGDMTELWAMYGDNGVGIDFVGSLPTALDYFTTNLGGQLYAASLGCAGPAFSDQLWSAGNVLAPQLYLSGGVIGFVEQTSQQNSSSSGPIYTDTNFNNYTVNYMWLSASGMNAIWPTFALTDPFPKYNNSGPFDGGGGDIASYPATIGVSALGSSPLGSDVGLS